MSTREFRAYRWISRPRVNQKSSPSQRPREKWKDTIIVSAWPKLQAIAKRNRMRLEKGEPDNTVRYSLHLKMKVCGVGSDIHRV